MSRKKHQPPRAPLSPASTDDAPPPAAPAPVRQSLAGEALTPRQALLVALVLAVAGYLAFRSGFHGAFVFDDIREIVKHPALKAHLATGELWAQIGNSSRPLVLLTLLANHALGGFDTYGYHLVNFGLHLATGWLLFLVVRRTLLSVRCRARYGRAALPLALAVALLWLLHPLTTQAVTYVIQRAEIMVSGCVLLALYATARATSAARPLGWYALLLMALVAGFGCKPVMVAAPVLVVLYAGVFGPGGWRRLWPAWRGPLLVLLPATLLLVLWATHFDTTTSNPVTTGRLAYLLTQGGVLTHYLSLVVWPAHLCFDYYRPVATRAADIVPACLFIGALLVASVVALWRWPGVGFVGLSFFALLGVTSSILPLADVAVEHRLYLALAAPLTLAVLAVHALGGWLAARPGGPSPARLRVVGWTLLLAVALALGLRTDRRNQDYRSVIALWEATATQAPANPRVWHSLGLAYLEAQRWADAEGAFAHFVALVPDDAAHRNNLGLARLRQHHYEAAADAFRTAVRMAPDFAPSHYNLGCAEDRLGHTAAAKAEYQQAVTLDPDYPEALNDLGAKLLVERQWDAAEALFRRCLAAAPTFARAQANLANLALARQHLARGEDVTVQPAPPAD